MEYQVTKPSFVRFNWTQTLITFAACFVACLLAGGCIYAVIYFIHKKQNAQNDLPTQAQQQRPIREERQEINDRQKRPHNHQENDQAENHQDQNQEESSQETDEKKPISKVVPLNGQIKKSTVKK